MSLALEFRDVSFAYAPGRFVLRGVSLSVEQGEFLAVAGPNGGGKTTLIRLGLGLERPTRGDVRLFDADPRRLRSRSRIGYLPQRAELAIDAPVTVNELVAAGRVAVSGFVGPLGTEDRGKIREAIDRVGLSEHAAAPLRTLSGGQQQRALIAKAHAADPELLVLDEPTVGVDVDAQEAIAALLRELNQSLGATVIYISHEFGAIERYVDRLVLVRGGIVFDGDPSALPDRWHDPSHVHL
jgi:zinc transport system ATP-binding protein